MPPGPPPAPTAPSRARPAEPPPPDNEIEGWDLWHKDRSLPLPPPPPPPDPFDPRAIVFKHDREVSMDGRIKEVRRIPQWVDVLERRDIEEWRPLSFGELMRRFPNVMVADGGSPFLAMPVIRGLGGDRVKILTDGVWPSTQALGVAGSTLSLWDPESTERVEVYHGPGAYLRGADAGGGVINIVPRRPHRHECPTILGNVNTSYNSADQRFRERVSLEGGSGRVAALGGVTYEDHGDMTTPDGTLDPSTYSSIAADLALDYFLDNQSTIGFTGQYVKAQDIRGPLGGGDLYNQPSYERLFLGLTLSSAQLGPVFHGSRMSLSFDSFFQNDDQNTTLGGTNGIASTDKVKRFDFSLQGNLYILPCHDTWAELSVGYARLERTESILCRAEGVGPARALYDRWYPDATVTTLADPGVCVQGVATFEAEELRITGLIEDETHSGCWDVHLGARLDFHYISDTRTGEDSTDLLWGVAGGAARHVSDCWTVFGNASYGQRHPSLSELFSVAVLDGITVFPDPDLDFEQSLNGEIGVKASRFNLWSFQAAVYAHWIGDYIGRQDIGTDQVWSNVGDVVLYGSEVAGSYRPNPCTCEGLELFGTAGVTFSDDHAVVRPMPLHGRAGARLSNCYEPKCGVRRWFVEAAARGGLDQGFSPDDSGDSFVTAEILGGVGWSFGNRRALWATLGVMNLLDESYTEPLARLPALGRSVLFSVSFDF